MDTRLSCLIRGIIGVVFGILALLLPGPLLITFFWIFIIVAGLAVGVFLFLAITSQDEDSMFWFGLAAVLLVLIAIAFLVPGVVEIISLLIIAGIAFYNGYINITLALTHPKTKYILILGMFIAGGVMLAAILWYVPVPSENLVVVVLGTFAFVFGLVSILMGIFQKNVPEQDLERSRWTSKDKTCEFHRTERKK
jgi:uncharacterized membrane protein HdeD (DUF308 family)